MAAAASTPPLAVLASDLAVDAQELAQQRLAVIGASGSGKTYAVGRILEQLGAAHIPFFVLDTVGVWPMLRLAANGRDPGLNVTIVGGDNQDVPLVWSKGRELAAFLYEHRTSAVLDLSDGVPSVRAPFVAAFCEQLLVLVKRRRQPLFVVFDEGPDLLPQVVGKGELAMQQAVSALIRKLRNHGGGTLITTQRPQDVAKGPLDQAGTMLVGALYGKHERSALSDWVGRKTRGTVVREQLDRLSELEPGQFFLWSPGWLKEYREIRVLEKWTYDGSSTERLAPSSALLKASAPVDLDALRELLGAGAPEETNMPEPARAKSKPAPSQSDDAQELDERARRLEARIDALARDLSVVKERHEQLQSAWDRRQAELETWRNQMPSGPLLPSGGPSAESELVARARTQAAPPRVLLEHYGPSESSPAARERPTPSAEAADLPQRALGALSAYGPLSFFEVALYARSSIKSGSLVRTLRTAVAQGLLSHDGGVYAKTQELHDRALAPVWSRGKALREAWESTLSDAQLNAWSAMLRAPLSGWSQPELCEAANVSVKSGSFVRALRALKGWQLLEGGSRNWRIPDTTRKAFGLPLREKAGKS